MYTVIFILKFVNTLPSDLKQTITIKTVTETCNIQVCLIHISFIAAKIHVKRKKNPQKN